VKASAPNQRSNFFPQSGPRFNEKIVFRAASPPINDGTEHFPSQFQLYNIPLAITAIACTDKQHLRDILCIFRVLQQFAAGRRAGASTTDWPGLKTPPPKNLCWKKQGYKDVSLPIAEREEQWGHPRNQSLPENGDRISSTRHLPNFPPEASPSLAGRSRAAEGWIPGTECSPSH
ncbi:hypothetical protein N332_09119, partial [Mesitornis unicolor]